jgi:subtilisin family serine protease
MILWQFHPIAATSWMAIRDRRIRIGLPALLAAILLMVSTAGAGPATSRTDPGTHKVVWVFFKDKGVFGSEAQAQAVDRARQSLTARALARRAKVRGASTVDLLDVPLHASYVEQVAKTGAKIRAQSRWLNAVSIEATPAQIEGVRALPFVARVQPVAAARRKPIEVMPVDTGSPSEPLSPRALNYGDCASQILPIQVNLLHDEGFTGNGILICMLDTGFLRTHEALLPVNVVAEHDFINDDNVTSNQPGDDPNQHNHGTYCLSIIGGFHSGDLIGPAFDADFILGKTEDVTSETPVEEDYWIEGAEWADGLGADVISSSLGYKDWYTYEDMDGETAPITIAADLAVSNGICVVNSAGNEGDDEWFHIIAPADGNNVTAVGAVDSLGVIAAFSSHGPSADGRIKPDVCAMGDGNLFALVSTPNSYGRGNGTSFSCPLVAGASALLLQKHPQWTPFQVRDALRSSAVNAAAPNNTYGWGLIRAWNASNTGVTDAPVALAQDPTLSVSPNPSHDVSVIRFAAGSLGTLLDAGVFDVSGRRIRGLPLQSARSGQIEWDGRDENGRALPSGIYWVKLQTLDGERSARIVRIR